MEKPISKSELSPGDWVAEHTEVGALWVRLVLDVAGVRFPHIRFICRSYRMTTKGNFFFAGERDWYMANSYSTYRLATDKEILACLASNT